MTPTAGHRTRPLAACTRRSRASSASTYRQINAADEASFKAALDPSDGKLDLNVDFYGLGLFPPRPTTARVIRMGWVFACTSP